MAVVRPRGAPVHLEVTDVEQITPSFRRVWLAGPDPEAYADPLPADAVRLVLPGEPGAPPVTRALTVSVTAPGRLAFDVLDHPGGVIHRWVADAGPGDQLSVMGMRCEFVVVPARRLVLVVDGTGLPAAAAILAATPPDCAAVVVASAPDPGDRVLITARPGDDVRWVDEISGAHVDAVAGLAPDDAAGTIAFVAAEPAPRAP